MKLTPLPKKFNTLNINSVTISPKEENGLNTTSIPKNENLANATPKNIVTKSSESKTNYILPLLLIGGGAWYLFKS